MERVKIQLPEKFNFTTSIPIRISDVNYGGHVGNDSFLSLIHEARLQYFASIGYSEMNIENVSIIMADAAIEFKAELFYGDIVIVSVVAANFSKLGFDLFYKMEKSDDKKTLVGKVKTGMLCFDYNNRKLAELPEAAKIKFT